MTDDTRFQTRCKVARLGIFLFLIGFGLRIFGAALDEETPTAAAAGIAPPTPTRAGPKIFVRFEWLSRCGAAETLAQLGLYTASDAPCQPSQAVSLAWLQSQLAVNGLLTTGEYIEPAPDAPNLPCSLRVLTTTMNQPAGWICSDANGLYRADGDGVGAARRVQLLVGSRQ